MPVEADLKMTRCLPIGGSCKRPQSDQLIILHVEKVFEKLIQAPAPNEFNRCPFHTLKNEFRWKSFTRHPFTPHAPSPTVAHSEGRSSTNVTK